MSMSQAKRRKKDMRGSAFNGFLLLCLGMVLGAVLTTLYSGYRSADGNAIGSGLRDFIANKTTSVASAGGAAKERVENAPRPATPKVDVEFHKRLADDEIVVARVEPERVSAAQKVIDAVKNVGNKSQQPKPVERVAGTRIAQLQVGSFSKRSDAERMKAEVALKGFAASVEPGQVDGKEMWRVRLGPYSTEDGTLEQVRQMLADNGLKSLEVGISRLGQ